MAKTSNVGGSSAGTSTGGLDASIGGRASEAVGSRVGAYLVDFTLLAVVSFGLYLVTFLASGLLGAAIGASGGGSDGAMLAASAVGTVVFFAMWVVIGAVVFGYFALLDAAGGTLGKRLVGMSVVTADGSPATRRDAAVRTAVLMAPFPVMALLGTFLGGIGFFFGLFLMAGWLLVEAGAMTLDDGGQRFGDRVAETYVVPG